MHEAGQARRRRCRVAIAMAAALCAGTQTEVSCVLAFPHGCVPPAVKACEAREAIANGTREIDMVANYGYIRSGMREEMLRDMRAVTDVAKPAGILVKVILEGHSSKFPPLPVMEQFEEIKTVLFRSVMAVVELVSRVFMFVYPTMYRGFYNKSL